MLQTILENDSNKHCFYIGNVRIPNRLVMAPMAGVTDHVFREIVFRAGAGLTVSEMVSAKSIVYGNKKTLRLLQNTAGVRPWSVQFFAHDPCDLSEAISKSDWVDFDIVDINMGCPMPKIVKNGEGAALMRNPMLVGKLVSAAVRASHRPVTIKIRTGFNKSEINCVQVARIAQESGVAAVAVHGRTREQYYSGEANWDHIEMVRDALEIPVIGNGDVDSPDTALKRLDSCDAVMIARGAMGNPWIFSRALSLITCGVLPNAPGVFEVVRAAKAHLQSACDNGIRLFEMRKHLAWYTGGMIGAAQIRRRINQAMTAEEMAGVLDSMV